MIRAKAKSKKTKKKIAALQGNVEYLLFQEVNEHIFHDDQQTAYGHSSPLCTLYFFTSCDRSSSHSESKPYDKRCVDSLRDTVERLCADQPMAESETGGGLLT